jgi:hypothetical protein
VKGNLPHMGIIHSCDTQRGVTFIVWDGIVTWDDWRQHVAKLLADPGWFATPRFIVDVQTVTDTSSIGMDEMEQVYELFGSGPAILANKRSAVIAKEEFSRAKRFGDLIARFGTSSIVFNTLDTACLFLGIDFKETRQVLEELRAELRRKDKSHS